MEKMTTHRLAQTPIITDEGIVVGQLSSENTLDQTTINVIKDFENVSEEEARAIFQQNVAKMKENDPEATASRIEAELRRGVKE